MHLEGKQKVYFDEGKEATAAITSDIKNGSQQTRASPKTRGKVVFELKP